MVDVSSGRRPAAVSSGNPIIDALDRQYPLRPLPDVPADNPFADLVDPDAPELNSSDGPRQGLSDIFADEFRKGQEGTGIGFAKDLSTAKAPDGRETRQHFDARYQLQPQYDTLLEWSFATAGRIAGGAATPENFIPVGLGAKVAGMAGASLSTIRARIFAGAVDAAATNAAIDAAIQGADVAAGFREDVSPLEIAQSAALGTVAGGLLGPITHAPARGEPAGAGAASEAVPAPAASEAAVPAQAAADARPAAAAAVDADIARTEAVTAGLKNIVAGQSVDVLDGPGGAPTGRRVTVDPDQTGAAAGMVRVVEPDGRTTQIGDRLLSPAEAPAEAPAIAAPAEAVAPEARGVEPVPIAELPPAAIPPTEEAQTLGEKLAFQADEKQAEPPPAKAKTPPGSKKAAKPPRPVSLFRFLAANGGIRDDAGTLAALDLGKVFVPGGGRLVRAGGRDLDHARELAAEAGYFPQYGTIEEAMAKSTPADLIDLLVQENRGERVYSGADRERLAIEEADAAARQQQERFDAAKADIDATAGELPPEIRERAAELVYGGHNPDDALERAIIEDYFANGEPEAPKGARIQEVDDHADPFESRAPGERDTVSPESGGSNAPPGGSRDAAADGRPLRDPAEDPRGTGGDVPFRVAAAPGSQRATAGVATAGVTPELTRLQDLTNALSDRLGIAAVRQGRLGRSAAGKVLGQFDRKSGVVRVRYQDDFDTFTHEAGHHLETKFGAPIEAAKQAHAAELTKLAYPGTPKGRELSEGFAEFVRLYMTNPAYAAKEAPGFHAAFRQTMGALDADVAKALDDVGLAYGAWLQQPSQEAVASTIVSGKRPGWMRRTREDMKRYGLGHTIADRIESAYSYLFDDLHPIQRATRALLAIHKENTGRTIDLPTSRDPYKLARMSRGAYASGHMDVVHGVIPYRGVAPASASLRDAIIAATGARNDLSRWTEAKTREFGAYLWSRRALGEWERYEKGLIPNPPDKLTKGDHMVNVTELEAANPGFRIGADAVYDWNRALWQKKRDAGLITDAQHQGGLEIVDYVPGLRAFDYDGDPVATASGTKGGSAKGGFVKRFRGSRRDVVNPLDSLMADAYETAMAIARNDVVKEIDRLARTAGVGGGAIAERIPAHELRAIMVDPLEAIEAAARSAGLAKPDVTLMRDAIEAAIGDEKAAIFRPAIINEKGETIAFFRDAGEIRALRLADGTFGKAMYTALTGMTRGEKSVFVEMLGVPATILRAGVTIMPEFILANFIRDQTMASIFYGKPLQRLAGATIGMGDEIFNREAARAYNVAGGIMGGAQTAALRDAQLERDLGALRRKGWTAQRLTSVRGLAAVSEISETGMRLGLFKTFRAEAKKRGLDDIEATFEAAWRARDHMDFDRRGSGMAALSRMVPFLNASLQGFDKVTRVMITPWAKKVLGETLTAEDERMLGQSAMAWARLAALTTMSVSVYAYMSQYEDQAEISTATRATHWMFKFGEKWVAVPKPFEMATVINLGEAAYDAFVQRDPSAGSRYLDGLYDVLLPPSILTGNPAIKYYFEKWANKDTFTDNPIVPDHLLALEPFLQYTAKTSDLAKTIGKAMNWSPIMVDHFITTFSSSFGRSALALYDMAAGDKPAPGWDDMPFTRRFIKDASKGATSVNAFWDLVSEGNGKYELAARSWRAMMQSGNVGDADDYLAGLPDEQRAYLTALSLKADVKRLHPLYRARLAVRAIGAVRRDLMGNRLVTAEGEPAAVSRIDAGAIDDILSDLAMAEARNALVTIGEPGWAGRTPIDTSTYHRELKAIAPDLYQVLADRLATAHVLPRETVEQGWPELRRRLLEDGTDVTTIDLTVPAKAGGTELGGTRIKRSKAPAVPGADELDD